MSRNYAALLGATMLALSTASARADLVVTFTESAPRDIFRIKNTGKCALPASTMEVNLRPSKAGLLFDTSASGPGVEVFQPFETKSPQAIKAVAEVKDGDRALAVRLSTLQPGASVTFTIDVDDTLTASELGQIRVSDSEIEGAIVSLKSKSATTLSASFDSNARATLPISGCSS